MWFFCTVYNNSITKHCSLYSEHMPCKCYNGCIALFIFIELMINPFLHNPFFRLCPNHGYFTWILHDCIVYCHKGNIVAISLNTFALVHLSLLIIVCSQNYLCPLDGGRSIPLLIYIMRVVLNHVFDLFIVLCTAN